MSDFVMPKRIAVKERLPDDRKGVTHHFSITDRDGVTIDGYLTVGLYENGQPGEIFIKVGKTGGEGAIFDELAKLFSVALQYGVPLENLCAKMVNTKYEPSGCTSNPKIPRTTSPTDYLARFLLAKYGRDGISK